MTAAIATTVFVVGLILSIMVHEWGHFATARRFGMRADRFFLGFGPTLYSRRVGETEYGVKLLPLGGFVRIAGMSPEDDRRQGVPAELAVRLADGDEDPVEVFAELLAERGAPPALATQLTDRFERTLEAGAGAAAGAPTGLDLEAAASGEEGGAQALARGHARATAVAAAAADDDDGHGHDGHGHDGHGHDDEHARATATVGAVDPVLLAVELIHSEVVPSGRTGDLHHRLVKGDEDRFFHDRPAWQRTIVLASGSVLHFAQAAVLIFLGWLLVGPTVVAPVIGEFATELPDGTEVTSAVEEAGLEVGDRITSIDGVASDDFSDLRAIIAENPGRPLPVTVEREGVDDVLSFTVTPEPVTTEDGETIGLFGFRPTPESRPMPADEALYATFVGPGSFPDVFVQTFGAIGDVFGPEGIASIFTQVAGQEERDPEGGVTLVGAAAVAGQGTDRFGPLVLFGLLAAVNVFVGIFNLIPLPPLDGGHIAVLGVEQAVNARRRMQGRVADFSVDPRTVASIALPVIALVATVSLALLYLDITSPLSL